MRQVEIVVNGIAVAKRSVPADGKVHDIDVVVDVDRSSWVALRQFPQLHTNPVNVIVEGKPIRTSRESALWCAETIKLLWQNRRNRISEDEREEARQTYQRAIRTYEQIAKESPSTRKAR